MKDSSVLFELNYYLVKPVRRFFLTIARRLCPANLKFLRTALGFEPWDWYYLLQMEQASMKRMLHYLEKDAHHADSWVDIRNLRICISLADAVLENRSIPKHQHVNFRNIDRLHLSPELKKWYLDRYLGDQYTRQDYYIRKAWRLYNKIRTERMFEWWD